VWPLTDLGESLNMLVFELKDVLRQTDLGYINALNMVRRGQPWHATAAGDSAFDYFEAHCSPRTPGKAALVTTVNGREYTSLDAVRRGYVTLVATNPEAAFMNRMHRKMAESEARRNNIVWRELTVTAIDGFRNLLDNRIYQTHNAAPDDFSGSRAPGQVTFWIGQAVAVASSTRSTTKDGRPVTLPSSLIGIVTDFRGTAGNVRSVGITVHFEASEYVSETSHTFLAVDIDEATPVQGRVKTRLMVQLRDGSCLSIHRAQSLSIRRLIVNLYFVNGAWTKAMLYAALTRGQSQVELVICNIGNGENRQNQREGEWVQSRALQTDAELVNGQLVADTPLVVRSVASFLARNLRDPEAVAKIASVIAGGAEGGAHLAILGAVGAVKSKRARKQVGSAAVDAEREKRLRALAEESHSSTTSDSGGDCDSSSSSSESSSSKSGTTSNSGSSSTG
jgi:hypothetical protein